MNLPMAMLLYGNSLRLGSNGVPAGVDIQSIRIDDVALHPAVVVAYLMCALAVMCVSFQMYLALTFFVGYTALSWLLLGSRAFLRGLVWKGALLIIVTAFNCLFGQGGSTVLFEMGPVCVHEENLMFGLCMGLMLVAMITLFECVGHLMTSDDALTLFGGSLPTTSLMFSMALGLMPQFRRRAAAMRTVARANTASPRQKKEGVRPYAQLLTMLMASSVEDALVRAHSMRARGWGSVRRRTSYVRTRFRRRDGCAIGIVAACGIAAVGGAVIISGVVAPSASLMSSAVDVLYVPVIVFALLPVCTLLLGRRAWMR